MVQKLAFADAHWMNQSGQFTPQVPMDKAQQVVVALHRRPLPLLLEWHSGPMPFGDAPAHHAQRVGNMIGAGGGGVGNVVLAIRVRQGLRWCRRRRFGRRSIAILRLNAIQTPGCDLVLRRQDRIRAMDIKNPMGEPVFAVLPGRVVEVSSSRGSGHYLKINHGNGMETSYSHTRASVSVGRTVAAGDTIGHSDGSGTGSAPHFHLVLRMNGRRVDPNSNLLNRAE